MSCPTPATVGSRSAPRCTDTTSCSAARSGIPPCTTTWDAPRPTTEIVAALRGSTETEFKKSDDIAAECAALVAKGRIIGWVQGGAEFRPRALGHRSIIADPRTPSSKERLDAEIKRREWFRPYAPSVLAEHADEYFEMLGPSPYMLVAVNTRPSMRAKVPAIVHVDGTARVQTVDARHRAALPPADLEIPRDHRRPARVEHQLQRLRRADGRDPDRTPCRRCTRWVLTRSPSATTSRGRRDPRRNSATWSR